MLFLLLGFFWVAGSPVRAEDSSESARRTQALGAFSRGESLSWDQLQVVASEAGVSPKQISELKLKDRVTQMIQRFRLPLEVSGYSNGLAPDEEFRLYRGRQPGRGGMLLNASFWSKGAGIYDTDAYLAYLLFRADAYFAYRSHFDAEHAAWIVEEESPAMQVLKAALEGSEVSWRVDDGPPTGRDLEFRQSLDPSKDPARTLKTLTEFALRCVAQKASDDWALLRFGREVGAPDTLITDRVRRRERALAWDFSRARSAMTRAERMAFQKLLKSPFRYVRQQGRPSSEAVYDQDVVTPK